MGIKLHCPNGHKLNVKSFLAGKKGVCPHCGASFRIPKAEERDASSAAAEAPAEAAPAVTPSVAPAVSPALAPAAPASPGAAVVPAGVAVSVPAMPVGQAVSPVTPAVVSDPIAEAPLANWYVRPPSGGQYGPARGEVMRKWIGEGRVSSDSLVWREGWTDWRGAGQLFPSLLNPIETNAPLPPVPAIQPVTPLSRSRAATAPRKGNGLAIVSVVFLALVCIALVVALVFVLGGVK